MRLQKGMGLVHVIQGDQAIGSSDDVVLTTVLGSCVAACLYDPFAKIGGMNHFLLPNIVGDNTTQIVYGAQAMELLINALLKKGANKNRLKAKLFGGANVVSGLSNIGERNANFAMQFLVDESIDCISQSLGGSDARRVRFWPASGRASLKVIGRANVEDASQSSVTTTATSVELF